ncbi:MAG: MBL fold metallo-hydrolase [Planctomycetes bacterium]|nr:MBL fold metallo-hydrolase [Planctomycetota bacterium]
MRIEHLTVGPLETGCYVVSCDGAPDAMIIDPGAEADRIIAYLAKNRLVPKYLVNTHGHIDHIGANADLKARFPNMQICVHADDAACLVKPSKNLSFLQGVAYKSPPADVTLKEDDVLAVGQCELKVIHVPGHTPGGICLVSGPNAKKGARVLFSGDSLFAGGIGRTDFPGGDEESLLSNLRSKVLSFDDNTAVYPGHGPPTTVGEERRSNPYL